MPLLPYILYAIAFVLACVVLLMRRPKVGPLAPLSEIGRSHEFGRKIQSDCPSRLHCDLRASNDRTALPHERIMTPDEFKRLHAQHDTDINDCI